MRENREHACLGAWGLGMETVYRGRLKKVPPFVYAAKNPIKILLPVCRAAEKTGSMSLNFGCCPSPRKAM